MRLGLKLRFSRDGVYVHFLRVFRFRIDMKKGMSRKRGLRRGRGLMFLLLRNTRPERGAFRIEGGMADPFYAGIFKGFVYTVSAFYHVEDGIDFQPSAWSLTWWGKIRLDILSFLRDIIRKEVKKWLKSY